MYAVLRISFSFLLHVVRKDEEIASLKELLIAKEKILIESDELMQEAQSHIEEKRVSTDRMTKEKIELAHRLEELQGKMETEYSKSNFAVKELQVTVDTLKKENSELQRELREYMGEKRFLGDASSVNDKESVVSGSDRFSIRTSESNELNVGVDLAKGLRSIQDRLMQHKSEIEQWKHDGKGSIPESVLNERNAWEVQR